MFILLFLSFGCLVAVITSAINYTLHFAEIENEISTEFELEKTLKLQIIHDFINHNQGLITAITHNPLTQNYLLEQTPKNLDNFTQLLLAISQADNHFYQVRYIDNQGDEVVRLQQALDSGQLYRTEPEQLQNKKNRYYFEAAMTLSNNQFWYSNFDLNIEHGQIEQPIRPTLRVASPVFLGEERRGFIIANINTTELFEQLIHSDNFYIHIIDKHGNYIASSTANNVWNKYLPNRTSFTNDFPQYEFVLSQNLPAQEEIYRFNLQSILQNEDEVQILLIPTGQLVQLHQKNHFLSAGLTAVTVLVVSFILSWFAAIIPTRLQQALRQAYHQIKRYADIVDKYVITSTTDDKGRIISVSSALAEATEFKASELIGRRHNLIRHPDTSDSLYQDIWSTISSGKIWTGEIKNMTKSGEAFWLRHVITPDMNVDGKVISYTSVSQNITLRKKLEALSYEDALTQVMNRRKLDMVIQSELERFLRYGCPFCIIILDIDNFKRVNDQYGHEIGDSVLIELAKLLKNNCRKVDFIGRWGGEEFMVICPETTLQGVLTLAESLRAKVANHFFEPLGKITASFGVTIALPNDDIHTLFSRADTALYQVKTHGKNRVIFCDENPPAKAQ